MKVAVLLGCIFFRALAWSSAAHATTTTLRPTSTPTPPMCPIGTPLLLQVDPVTSPTNQLSQVIRVYIGNADRVEVVGESGHYILTGDFNYVAPAEVSIALKPSRTNHLTVTAHVRAVQAGDCFYPDYTVSTTVDRFGVPLHIVQEGYPPSPTPVVTDVRGFSEFHFDRHSALGFCPPLDAPFSASILALTGGGYRLEMSVLREGTAGVDVCVPSCCVEFDCGVAVPVPPRGLNEAEIARMQGLFSMLPTYAEPDPSCVNVAYDPCVINVVRWDAFGADDYPCSTRRIDHREVDAITNFLDDLRPDRTPPPSPTPTPTIEPPTPLPTATFLPEPLLVFAFSVEPPRPNRGDRVRLTVSVHNTQGFAGQPRYGLLGARPHLLEYSAPVIDPPNHTVLGATTLTYDLRAVSAGRADLRLSVSYETCLGYPGGQPCFRGGTTSEVFALSIGLPSPPLSTPTGTSTATPEPSPSPTLISSSGCAVAPGQRGASASLFVWLAMVGLILRNATLRTFKHGDRGVIRPNS